MGELLNQPARQILSEFGKGIGMPGSGGVSMLSVISASQLLVSVCKLTLGKSVYEEQHEEIEQIKNELERAYLLRLEQLMEDDIAVVKNMLRERVARDKATDDDKKETHKQKAKVLLEDATVTVMEFCNICLDIIPKALHVYRNGLKSAQGDTAAVISILLSGASSALFAALANIKSAKGADWTISKRAEAEIYFGRLHEYQYIFSGKLATLYNSTQS